MNTFVDAIFGDILKGVNGDMSPVELTAAIKGGGNTPPPPPPPGEEKWVHGLATSHAGIA